jgi:hypothetical protein
VGKRLGTRISTRVGQKVMMTTRIRCSQYRANTSPITSFSLPCRNRKQETMCDRLKQRLKHDPPGNGRAYAHAQKTWLLGVYQSLTRTRFFSSFVFYESDPLLSTRTVRTLSPSPVTALAPLPRTTLPPARVKKFLANALALHGESKRASKYSPRWERRPRTLNISCILSSLNSPFLP